MYIKSNPKRKREKIAFFVVVKCPQINQLLKYNNCFKHTIKWMKGRNVKLLEIIFAELYKYSLRLSLFL